MITIRCNSLIKYCWIFKYLAGYWNYHVQSILAQNPDHRPNDLGNLLNNLSGIFAIILGKK